MKHKTTINKNDLVFMLTCKKQIRNADLYCTHMQTTKTYSQKNICKRVLSTIQTTLLLWRKNTQ